MRENDVEQVASFAGKLRANTEAYVLDYPDGGTTNLLIAADVADLVGKFVVVSGAFCNDKVLVVDRIASLPLMDG